MIEKDQKARLKRRVTIALVVLPFVIAAFVLGGVFLGFYLADILGIRGSVLMPLVLSTLGLIGSLMISYVAAKRAATV